MLNANLGLISLSFMVNITGIVPTFVIFVLRMEYSLQKLEVRVEN